MFLFVITTPIIIHFLFDLSIGVDAHIFMVSGNYIAPQGTFSVIHKYYELQSFLLQRFIRFGRAIVLNLLRYTEFSVFDGE